MTHNLRDFPSDRLSPWGVAARHPDGFLTGLHQDHPSALDKIVTDITAARGGDVGYSDVLNSLAIDAPYTADLPRWICYADR